MGGFQHSRTRVTRDPFQPCSETGWGQERRAWAAPNLWASLPHTDRGCTLRDPDPEEGYHISYKILIGYEPSGTGSKMQKSSSAVGLYTTRSELLPPNCCLGRGLMVAASCKKQQDPPQKHVLQQRWIEHLLHPYFQNVAVLFRDERKLCLGLEN